MDPRLDPFSHTAMSFTFQHLPIANPSNLNPVDHLSGLLVVRFVRIVHEQHLLRWCQLRQISPCALSKSSCDRINTLSNRAADGTAKQTNRAAYKGATEVDVVQSALQETMTDSCNKIIDTAHDLGCTYRMAGYVTSMERIRQSYDTAGIMISG